MDQQPTPAAPQPKPKTPLNHLYPVIAVIFAMAVATAIFAWILWPRDEDVGNISTKMNLNASTNTTQNSNTNTFVTNTNTNANSNANANTNSNTNS